MMELLDNPELTTFTCEAMNTTFSLRLKCSDAPRAEETASACINQLSRLEADLSRFRHDSDVSRINSLKAGESLLISENTYACLRQAFDLQAITGGLFDVTLGSLTWPEDHDVGSGTGEADRGQLELAPDQPLIRCITPGRQIDLGGIGKGYALDQLALILDSYRIDSALLCAGASTMLALGPDTWPISLGEGTATTKIAIQDRALSASGIGVQGAHVIHPDFLDDEPPYIFERVWVITNGAATADACSTAVLLMDDGEIDAFADSNQNDITIYTQDIEDSEIRLRV